MFSLKSMTKLEDLTVFFVCLFRLNLLPFCFDFFAKFREKMNKKRKFYLSVEEIARVFRFNKYKASNFFKMRMQFRLSRVMRLVAHSRKVFIDDRRFRSIYFLF
jgi:hypothetical protein